MIEHFKQWLDEKTDVTPCNPEKNDGLQNKSSNINDVTLVTHVTPTNTSSCEAYSDSRPQPPETNASFRPGKGYSGSTGYNADSEETFPVTDNKEGRVTKVTNSELNVSVARLETLDIALRIESSWAGSVWLVSNHKARRHVDTEGIVYTVNDALHLIELNDAESRMLHRFRQTFGGTIRWGK